MPTARPITLRAAAAGAPQGALGDGAAALEVGAGAGTGALRAPPRRPGAQPAAAARGRTRRRHRATGAVAQHASGSPALYLCGNSLPFWRRQELAKALFAAGDGGTWQQKQQRMSCLASGCDVHLMYIVDSRSEDSSKDQAFIHLRGMALHLTAQLR